jgi:hypothetical protein
VRRTMIVLAFLLGTVTLPLPASAAVAATCGAMLTTDAYLAADLRCPGGDGLTLADGVTLDLRGHRLVGPGPSAGTAVAVADVEASATVIGGRIEEWGTGIGPLGSAYNASVRGVTIARTGTGMVAHFGVFAISDSRFADSGTGVSVFYGSTTISSTAFARNRVGVDGNEDGSVVIADSTFTDHEYAVAADGALIIRSTLRHGTVGVAVAATVRDSTIAYFTAGLRLPGSVRGVGLVENTRFIGNDTAIPLDRFGTQGIVRSNTFLDNVNGITVSADVDWVDVTVEGNTLTRNGNGIVGTAPPTVRLKANTATRNIGWGINLPGAVDLGGNAASGNGRSPQCVGVVCS